jgi:hypothetical protein
MEQAEHITITRHITETKWYCVDKERCEQLDEQIASATYHLNTLSANVADKNITGLECLTRERLLKQMIVEFRKERAGLWRRGKKEIDEVVDSETGAVLSSTRRVVQPRTVKNAVDAPYEAVFDPSVEGKPLVQIRHV